MNKADVQITVATENGDYSVSTNDTFAHALYGLGLDVTTRRLFPSNIKGAPSRYIIRVSESQEMAPSAEPDVALVLIPENAEKVIGSTSDDGVVVYDPESEVGELIDAARSGGADASELYREELDYLPVPLSQMASEKFSDVRMKKIMRNVIYVGFLNEFLGLPFETLAEVFKDSFSDKGEKIVENNLRALKLGRDYARNEVDLDSGPGLEPRERESETLLMRGNDATALGAVMGGCTYASWYPITPATSHGENLERYSRRYPIIVEQGENEDSCLGRALGASWAGARASVSTSGPGLSNMAEFIGYSSFTEIPVVIFDIQRVGPSTGLPTHTKQGDIRSVLHISHDEAPRVVLTPSTVEQLYEYSWKAFNIAARYQLPVVVVSDLELGLSFYTVDELEYPDDPVEDGKVLTAAEVEKLKDYSRYEDVDGDGICPRTLPGKGPTYVTRGAYHSEDGTLSEAPEDCRNKIERLYRKMDTLHEADDLPGCRVDERGQNEVGFIAFGSSVYSVREARQELEESGLSTSLYDISSLSPFPKKRLHEYLESHRVVFVVEQNYTGQLMSLIREKLGHGFDLRPVRKYDGHYLTARYITRQVKEEVEL